MRAVCQRVLQARVTVGAEVAGEIGPGLCVLLGVAAADGEAEAERLAARVARLRVFAGADGRFDRSVVALDLTGRGDLLLEHWAIRRKAKMFRSTFDLEVELDQPAPGPALI